MRVVQAALLVFRLINSLFPLLKGLANNFKGYDEQRLTGLPAGRDTLAGKAR
mgnify:CR=1 FL=1